MKEKNSQIRKNQRLDGKNQQKLKVEISLKIKGKNNLWIESEKQSLKDKEREKEREKEFEKKLDDEEHIENEEKDDKKKKDKEDPLANFKMNLNWGGQKTGGNKGFDPKNLFQGRNLIILGAVGLIFAQTIYEYYGDQNNISYVVSTSIWNLWIRRIGFCQALFRRR